MELKKVDQKWNLVLEIAFVFFRALKIRLLAVNNPFLTTVVFDHWETEKRPSKEENF